MAREHAAVLRSCAFGEDFDEFGHGVWDPEYSEEEDDEGLLAWFWVLGAGKWALYRSSVYEFPEIVVVDAAVYRWT